MGRSPCCSKEGLNRGAWTAQEDQILSDYIKTHGEGRWRDLPQRAGLKRCGKSCRLRWLNYLRPDIKRGNISPDEEELIIRLHKLLGNRWSLIAGRLPGRTDNEIKNYWNTNLGKRVTKDQPNISSSPRNIQKPFSNRTTSPSPSKNNNEATNTHVVRTKARKCSSNVFFHLQKQSQPHEPHHQNNCNPLDKETHLPTLYGSDQMTGYNPVWSGTPNDAEDHFNLEEFCNSDLLLNSDDLLDFNTSNVGIRSEAPKDQDRKDENLILFSEEMWEDWTRVRDSLVDPDFQSLASFYS
ncbi:hypothetical protein UlMin_021980 [Ulmus minor]